MRIMGIIIALGILPVSCPTAVADVIELRTGQRVEGTLKQATPVSVSVEVAGQTITFEGEKVRAIYFGAAPAAGSPTAESARNPAVQALDALRAINSVVTAGVAYREYSARVLDGKVAVDKALPQVQDTNLKNSLSLASEFYVIVSSAWSAELTRSGSEGYAIAGRNPALKECPAMWEQIEKAAANRRPPPRGIPETSQESFNGMTVSFRKQLLWRCASDKITEAEKLLGSAK